MSSGIQIISFGILYRYASDRYREADDLTAAYYMIFHYGWNSRLKKILRQLLSNLLGIPVPEVKALLTAYANGSSKKAGASKLLAQFREESDLLRREVISVIETHEPAIRELAASQSKHSFPEDIDWEDSGKDDANARAKASVYFFIWTYFEKQIRDAMLSLVDDGIPVHDAIYSKRVVPFEDFETVIQNRTGFEVRIGG